MKKEEEDRCENAEPPKECFKCGTTKSELYNYDYIYMGIGNIKIMAYDQFKTEVKKHILAILGEYNSQRDFICKKCYNKRMNISDTVSYIILNS